jgi:hypothetical protein
VRRHAAIVMALGLAVVAGEPADAGTYEVFACGSAPVGENNTWAASNSAPASLAVVASCPPGTDPYGGLRVYDVLGSANAPAAARAEWRFVAPPGTRIVRWRYHRYLGKDGTNSWHPYARLGSGATLDTCTIPLGSPNCSVGAPGYGSAGTARDSGAIDTDSLEFGVECLATGGNTCATGGLTIHRVWAALYASTVTIREDVPPALGAPSGTLVDGGWQSGVRSVAFAATDGVGVAATRVYVDGALRHAMAHPCDYTFAVPCDDVPGAAHSLDTTALADGEHALVLAAVDAAGNERRGAALPLRVDNEPPVAWISAPAGTTTSEQLYVSWSGTDAGAGVAGYDVDVSVDEGPFATWHAGTNATGATYLAPRGHTYRFRMRVSDATGKTAEATSDEVRVEHPPAPGEPGGGSQPQPAPGTDDPGGGDAGGGTEAARSDPALAVRSIRIRGNRLLVSGTLAPAARGRVRVSLRPGRAAHALRGYATPRRGRFTATIALRGRARRGGRLTVHYGGDASHAPATLKRAVRTS